jgi:fructokinase
VARAERYVAAAHVVKASDEDIGWLYPDRAPAEVLRAWTELGPTLVVMTRGPDGCVARTVSGDEVELPGRPVAVVDTIGAGDAFQSGLLSGLLDAGLATPHSIDTLTRETLHDVLDRAVRVSALTCGRAGADPPTRAELDAAD